MPRILSILVLFMLLPIGCATSSDGTWKAPLVYRVDVQQGNVVDQAMINKLKPGMDKKQVKYIMGTPLITDTFHGNRWDYMYSFEPGRGGREQRRITLFFKEDKLDRVEGDIKVSDKPRVDEEMTKERSVVVPLEEDKPGIFKRMFSRDKDKKDAVEEKAGSTAATAAPAAKTTIDAKTGSVTTDTLTKAVTTDLQKQPAGVSTDTLTEDVTAETQGQPAVSSDKSDSAAESVATTNAKDETGEKSTAGDTQEKNLVRRFWDRMTKGGDEGDVEVETEQDRRDAEVLEGAGGDL